MLRAVYGWRRKMPLAGRDIISIFSEPTSADLIHLGTIADPKDIPTIEELCKHVAAFIGNISIQSPVISYSDTDPLDVMDDVEFIMEELASYNDMDLLHSTYIETTGADPEKFSRILRHAPEYIGIKFMVPESGGDSHPVRNALDCLNRAIYTEEVYESERYLIIMLNKNSDVSMLRSYFEIIRDGLGSDKRFDFAPGSALSSFDVIIRPQGADIGAILDAQRVILDPDIDLSQQVVVDTGGV